VRHLGLWQHTRGQAALQDNWLDVLRQYHRRVLDHIAFPNESHKNNHKLIEHPPKTFYWA
jgi:hypothetical protein